MLVDALEHLSPLSRRGRFLSAIAALTPERLCDLTATDRSDRFALIAVNQHETTEVIALAEFVRFAPRARAAELAIMVADDWQGTGLGTHLFRLLAAHAGRAGIDWFTGTIQYSNVAALRLVRRVGAQIHLDAPGVLRADIDLRPLTAACDSASNDRGELSLEPACSSPEPTRRRSRRPRRLHE